MNGASRDGIIASHARPVLVDAAVGTVKLLVAMIGYRNYHISNQLNLLTGMTQPSKDPGQGLTLDERFVRAQVVIAQPTVLEVRVISHTLVTNARIHTSGLPEDYAPDRFLPDQPVDIFLLHPFRNEADYWYASLTWGERDANPWLTNRPRLGDEFKGRVLNFTGPGGAIITSDEGLEAFLPLSELPIQVHGDIASVLDLGDGIAAEIISVKEETLRIVVSIAALRRRRDQQTERQRDRLADNVPTPPAPTPLPAQSLAGKVVLVVDDEGGLRTALVRWLTMHGAIALPARDRSSLRAGLATPGLGHVLLDYLMPDREALWTLVAQWQTGQAGRQVLVMSATDASKEAARHGWPQAWKPMAVANLIRWIHQGLLPEQVGSDHHHTYNRRIEGQIEEQAVRDRFRQLLQKLCDLHGLAAGLWVLRLRPGKYSLRAHHGLTAKPDDDVHIRLSNTLAANCIESSQIIPIRVGGNDPLRQLLPDGVSHALALPVITDSSCERCLVFYADSEIADPVRHDLQSYLGEVELLVTQITLIRQMREQETLAATGLMTAGLFHELRHAIAVLALDVEEVNEAVEEGELEPPTGKLKQSLARVTDLLDSNLSLVQKQRHDSLDVNAVVRRLASSIARKRRYRQVQLVFRPAPNDPEINLSPMVLEQPLINLLDNALHHAAKRAKGGRVEVRVEIDNEDAATPIHIIVADNADGMGADGRQRLFQARETTKGEDGVGMGLFVSRNLARSAGGEVECLYTWRWIGSAFRIRLPALLSDSVRTP